ncbi:putative L-amino-acid oxidase [Rosellinia necatrix]|uniref:Putative L-amino-acid oxidase n=1 Tax=Rosellinia necatrix TaxID=77044 RepID=A0A1W2TWY2_ROSNE|nr:putative L-amino-acid oxidase [Rosellinia necatrix]
MPGVVASNENGAAAGQPHIDGGGVLLPSTAISMLESFSGKALDDETLQVQEEFLKIIDETPEKVAPIREPGVRPIVTIIGAGISGLCAGYELNRRGFDVRILERSSRVGGRIITFRSPVFAPGLHAEGGAMRIPGSHGFVHKYLEKFGMKKDLVKFEMKNKFIHLSAIGKTLTVDKFEELLDKLRLELNPEEHNELSGEDQPTLDQLKDLFPGLKDGEKGKTADVLFGEATKSVRDAYHEAYRGSANDEQGMANSSCNSDKIRVGYKAITEKYDDHTLRSFLEKEAKWSQSAINLYNWSNAHVVFENSFIESVKDDFLSSNTLGQRAQMWQLRGGMDTLPEAFFRKLEKNITFGARVTRVSPPESSPEPVNGAPDDQISTVYETAAGDEITVKSDYVIFAVPYPAQRMITKSQRFQEAKENAIMEVRYVQVTKVLLQYKKRWWDDELQKAFGEASRGTGGGLVTDLPIRYTMFPTAQAPAAQDGTSERAVIMAAYAFGQDASLLGGLEPVDRVRKAAEDLETAFPGSKHWLETGTSQAFCEDRMAGGSAFCYFAPGQKAKYLEVMREPEWPCQDSQSSHVSKRAFFAGEHASYAHGWIQGAMGVALKCVREIVKSHEALLKGR